MCCNHFPEIALLESLPTSPTAGSDHIFTPHRAPSLSNVTVVTILPSSNHRSNSGFNAKLLSDFPSYLSSQVLLFFTGCSFNCLPRALQDPPSPCPSSLLLPLPTPTISTAESLHLWSRALPNIPTVSSFCLFY